MIAKGAHHVSLTVSDIAKSRAFYGDLLGLPEIERPDFGIPGAWYQAGAVQLHLIEAPAAVDPALAERGVSPVANHVAFEVEDYVATVAALEAAGLQVVGLGDQAGQAFACDPDGHVIEFIQPGGQLGRR